MSYATEAEKLITSEPPCQSRRRDQLTACEPGCVHEQLAVERAKVYTGLEIIGYLDTIAAQLGSIASNQ